MIEVDFRRPLLFASFATLGSEGAADDEAGVAAGTGVERGPTGAHSLMLGG